MKFDLNIDKYSLKDLIDIFDLKKENFSNRDVIAVKYNNLVSGIRGQNIPLAQKTNMIDFINLAYGKIHKFIEIENNITMDKAFLNKKNRIFETSNHQIIKPNNNENHINPLIQKTTTKLININTKFRKNYFNQQSTNFTFDLTNELKNVISMSLVSIRIPKNSFYPISSKLQTNEFTMVFYEGSETTGKPYTIKIMDGIYTGTQLQNYLNEYVFTGDGENQDLSGVVCELEPITNKFRFYKDIRTESSGGAGITDRSNIKKFDIDWRIQSNKDRAIQFNLGWLLGYKKQYYKYSDDYVETNKVSFDKLEGYSSDSVFNTDENYFLLSIDDYNNNHAPLILSPFQQSVFNDNNLLALIPYNQESVNYEDINYDADRKYFGPVSISKIKVNLLDQYGRTVDLNDSDFSFTLKVEQLYNGNNF